MSWDNDGYPTEETLKIIEEWPYEKGYESLLEFVKENWWYPEAIRERGRIYRISTVGWSGNEDIIGSLKKNSIFWLFCWRMSKRGGHYLFEIPTDLQRAKTDVYS